MTRETERNRNNALLITAQTEEIRRLTIDRDAWRLTAKTLASGAQGTQAMTLVPCKWCGKLSDTNRLVCSPLLSWDRSARAEIERLTLENWQLKGALGYPVPGNIPEGPFKCGLCEARALQDPFRAGFETAIEEAAAYIEHMRNPSHVAADALSEQCPLMGCHCARAR
jgi:hypothetical protein